LGSDDYNQRQMVAGHLRPHHISRLTQYWQEGHGLVADGFCGPKTLATLTPLETRYWPLKRLPDGRVPTITSGYKTRNPSRPTHNGVDIFYRAAPEDSGLPKNRNTGRWCIPVGTVAVAPCNGIVVSSRPGHKTGGLVWVRIDGTDLRVGFMHLVPESVSVTEGQLVKPGDVIGEVGANPIDRGGLVHLHFEISALYEYHTQDPEDWLQGAAYV